MDFDRIARRINQWVSTIDGSRLVGYIYLLGILLFMAVIWARYRKDFMSSIFGLDKKLSIPELVVFVWFILFPNVVLADLFLDLHASDGVWWSLNIIMLFALTGKVISNLNPSAAMDTLTKRTETITTETVVDKNPISQTEIKTEIKAETQVSPDFPAR